MTVQHVDPDVSRRKFEREINDYWALDGEYRRRGWFLVQASFPRVLVLLASSKTIPPVVVMGVEFDYSNYDADPPSVKMVNPFTGEPYKFKDLPARLDRALPHQEFSLPGMPPMQKMMMHAAQPYMQAHLPDDIPFLCLAGVREYHEHPAHNGDVWELHRASGAGRLVRLLDIIHRYGVAPVSGFAVQLVPQVALGFGPAPE